jgi:RNAse (barnase) inhibitor barstar
VLYLLELYDLRNFQSFYYHQHVAHNLASKYGSNVDKLFAIAQLTNEKDLNMPLELCLIQVLYLLELYDLRNFQSFYYHQHLHQK